MLWLVTLCPGHSLLCYRRAPSAPVSAPASQQPAPRSAQRAARAAGSEACAGTSSIPGGAWTHMLDELPRSLLQQTSVRASLVSFLRSCVSSLPQTPVPTRVRACEKCLRDTMKERCKQTCTARRALPSYAGLAPQCPVMGPLEVSRAREPHARGRDAEADVAGPERTGAHV